MSHRNRPRNWRRPGDAHQAEAGFGPQGVARGAHEAGHGPEHYSEEYFGREPFTCGRAPRYYGTGVPGYIGGPGYTGGHYGYGDEPPDIPTELERAYAYDVYGYGPGTYEPAYGVARYPSGNRLQPGTGYPPRRRRYPPGPKGYVRSDERIREDVCERIAGANHVDSSEVTVEVLGGKVVLEGTVPDRRMKHTIEDLAEACPGVQDIDDRIRVQTASSGSRAAATPVTSTKFPADALPVAPAGLAPGMNRR